MMVPTGQPVSVTPSYGRPCRTRGHHRVGDRYLALQVDHREVGIVADRDAALAGDLEKARGTGRGEVYEALDAEAPGRDVIEHHRHERLHARHAGGRLRIGLRLLGQRMRRVVGAQHVRGAVGDRLPDALAVAGFAHRRVHLQAGAEARVLRSVEGEMLRRHLDRDGVLVVADEVHLLGRGDMEEMDASALLLRDAGEAPGWR